MNPADAWDGATCCERHGREACEDPDCLPPRSKPNGKGHESKAPPRLTFVAATDLIRAPRAAEIVEGVAFADRITVLASESGTGKTFVLLNLSAAVSSAETWHGRHVLQGSVAYVSFEGDDLSLRLRALPDPNGHRLEHVYVVRATDPLSPRVTRDGEERSIGELTLIAALDTLTAELRQAARPPIALTVIDTVRASLSGSEDSSEHVSAYLRAVRRILATVPGSAGLLAHHAGWQDGENRKQRERGSSAWRGNCDATLYLEADTCDASGSARLTLQALKIRDAEKPAPLYFVRRRVSLPELDRHGRPVTSCIIEPDTRSRDDREAERVAAVEASFRALDVAVLRAIRDYPAATSIKRLQPYLAQRTDLVRDAVARLLRAGLVTEGKRGQPYTLTKAGMARANGYEP